MNKVFLIGNLTRDPELTETQSGVSVCRFSLAVNRNYTGADGERQADFFNCTAWRGLAETVAKYCKKGKKLAVVGTLQVRSYEDNEGVKRTVTDVVAQEVEFLSSPDTASAPTEKKTEGASRRMSVYEDDGDIPF